MSRLQPRSRMSRICAVDIAMFGWEEVDAASSEVAAGGEVRIVLRWPLCPVVRKSMCLGSPAKYERFGLCRGSNGRGGRQ